MSERECGECGLCCKVIGVRELEKAPHVWCRYYRRGRGCEVYTSRPEGCAQFACDWLLDVQLEDAWRPDRSGFVLHTGAGGRLLNVDVDPANPSAWRKAPFEATLRAWARAGGPDGLEVLVWTGRRCLRLEAGGGETDLGERRSATEFTAAGRNRRPGSGRDWPPTFA